MEEEDVTSAALAHMFSLKVGSAQMPVKKKRRRKKKHTGNIPLVGFWHRLVNKSVVRTQVVPTTLPRNQSSKSPADLVLERDQEEFSFPTRPETQLTAGKNIHPTVAVVFLPGFPVCSNNQSQSINSVTKSYLKGLE